MINDIYSDTIGKYFKKPLLVGNYFTPIGFLLLIVYFFTKNRIIGLIALNINLAILFSTEYIRWQQPEIYKCFITYINNNINLDISFYYTSLRFVIVHYLPTILLLFNIRTFLRIPLNTQLYYSLIAFLVFFSWSCISNDCVNMQQVYFKYDDSACKYKIKKTISIKIMIMMLLGAFMIPVITMFKKRKEFLKIN